MLLALTLPFLAFAAVSDLRVLREVVRGTDTARLEQGKAFRFLALAGRDGVQRKVLSHPVHWMDLGDLDGNGKVDVVVGLTKANRHDPVLRRRIQIWTRGDRELKPVWLGTRLVADHRECRLVKGTSGRSDLLALEKRNTGWLVARMSWNGFGFVADSMVGERLGQAHAQRLWKEWK
ncbi:MAG: hypothetical protein RL318_399 [Fibrobacterota bacterium]|jgi:hypothetical protein